MHDTVQIVLQVILCTDGLANRGIGNLDGTEDYKVHYLNAPYLLYMFVDHKCTESSAAFYKKLGMTAMESRYL